MIILQPPHCTAGLPRLYSVAGDWVSLIFWILSLIFWFYQWTNNSCNVYLYLTFFSDPGCMILSYSHNLKKGTSNCRSKVTQQKFIFTVHLHQFRGPLGHDNLPGNRGYRMGPPSYKLVYKPLYNPHEYYSYIYHKPENSAT